MLRHTSADCQTGQLKSGLKREDARMRSIMHTAVQFPSLTSNGWSGCRATLMTSRAGSINVRIKPDRMYDDHRSAPVEAPTTLPSSLQTLQDKLQAAEPGFFAIRLQNSENRRLDMIVFFHASLRKQSRIVLCDSGTETFRDVPIRQNMFDAFIDMSSLHTRITKTHIISEGNNIPLYRLTVEVHFHEKKLQQLA